MNDSQTRAAISCRLKLQRNFTAILNNLRADEIVDKLFENGVIAMHELEELSNNNRNARDQMRQLLKILLEMPDFRMETAFNTFITTVEPDYDWLAAQIRTTQITEADIDHDLAVFDRNHPEPPQHNRRSVSSASAASASIIASAGDQPDATAVAEARRISISRQTSSRAPINEQELEQQASRNENEEGTIAYASGILVFSFIRGVRPREQSQRNLGAASSTGRQGSGTNTCPIDSSTELRDISFGDVVRALPDRAHEFGIGERQTTLNVRETATTLRDLADLFEKSNGRQMDAIVNRALQGEIHEDPDWFTTLAHQVLQDGVSWGRIISLFVFASRIVQRVVTFATNAISDLTRRLASVVFGFARLVRDRLANWLRTIGGGWLALLDTQQRARIETEVERLPSNIESSSSNTVTPSPTSSSLSTSQNQDANTRSLSQVGVALCVAAFAVTLGIYLWRDSRG